MTPLPTGTEGEDPPRLDEVAGYLTREVTVIPCLNQTRSEPQKEEEASHGTHCHRSRCKRIADMCAKCRRRDPRGATDRNAAGEAAALPCGTPEESSHRGDGSRGVRIPAN